MTNKSKKAMTTIEETKISPLAKMSA